MNDDVVKEYYEKYYNKYDSQALDMSLPDKFTYECCSKYLWDNWRYTMKKVILFLVIVHCIVSSIIYVNIYLYDHAIVYGIILVIIFSNFHYTIF